MIFWIRKERDFRTIVHIHDQFLHLLEFIRLNYLGRLVI